MICSRHDDVSLRRPMTIQHSCRHRAPILPISAGAEHGSWGSVLAQPELLSSFCGALISRRDDGLPRPLLRRDFDIAAVRRCLATLPHGDAAAAPKPAMAYYADVSSSPSCHARRFRCFGAGRFIDARRHAASEATRMRCRRQIGGDEARFRRCGHSTALIQRRRAARFIRRPVIIALFLSPRRVLRLLGFDDISLL